MTAARCCQRKSVNDKDFDTLDRQGYVDHVKIERAMSGHPSRLNRAEAEALVVALAHRRSYTLKMIQAHTGYSRSQVAAILAKRRGR